MSNNKPLQDLQDQWERAIERAEQETLRPTDLGAELDEGAGLHIKSGVQAGGLWGTTTSCTCNQCVS